MNGLELIILRILLHFNNISVILQLGSRIYPFSEVEVTRLGFEPLIHKPRS